MQFTCRVPGVAEMYPIIKASDLKHEWLTRSVEEYRQSKPSEPAPLKVPTIVRCPGIRTIMQTGWIVRIWQDLYIEVHADGSCSWNTPIDQKLFDNSKAAMVEFHDPLSFQFNNALKHKVPVLKLQMPWTVIVPKGYSILQMGVAYQDQDMFSVAPGIFSWEYGSYHLNAQLLWEKAGSFLIPAGTPIMQLILMKDIKPSASMRKQTAKDVEWDVACTNAKQCRYATSFGHMKSALKEISTKFGVWT